jgi:hypothetical protein
VDLVSPVPLALGAVLVAVDTDELVAGVEADELASVVEEVLLQAVAVTARATANSDRDGAFWKGEKIFIKKQLRVDWAEFAAFYLELDKFWMKFYEW